MNEELLFPATRLIAMTLLLPPCAITSVTLIHVYSRLWRIPACSTLLVLLIVLLLHPYSAVLCLSPDGQALLAFHRTMQNPDPRLQWNPADDTPCNWFGVTCSSATMSTPTVPPYIDGTSTKRVVAISLSSIFLHGSLSLELGKLSELRILNLSFTNISGSIPPELADASMLELLDLSLNSLTGSIPAELGMLTELQSLVLYSNNLMGSIPPSIGNCSALRLLWLHDNNLTGNLPSQLGNLTRLENFRIGGNTLLSGPLPPELGNCRNLTQLGAAATGISGTIPVSFGYLTNIQILSLYSTKLTGSIPPELGNCSRLQYLFLHLNHLVGFIPSQLGKLQQLNELLLWGNALEGAIPPEIGACTALQVLDFSTNKLSGPIPREIGNLTSLEQLLLSVNLLNGSIPAELTNCVGLTDIELDNNQLSGSIPASLGKLKQLETVFIWNNSITGPMPSTLGGCLALQAIDFSYNQLTGAIPKEIFGLKNLVKLILLSNNLTGSIPPEVGDCKSLIRLRLPINQLTGPLPKELGELHSLEFLDLYENQLEGPLPAQISSLTSLQSLDAHSNKLTGSLPPELSSLSNLQQLDLGSNKLTGAIPSDISGLHELNKLVLTNNALMGSIPSTIQFCQKLTLLDLSHNQLTGPIPPEIGNITSLDIALDLSWNNLTGPIPDTFSHLTQLQSLDLSNNGLSGSLDVLSSMESLAFLNVSFNLFSGLLPDTPFFRTLSPSSVLGNPGLCDSSSSSCGFDENPHKPGGSTTSLAVSLFISAAAAMFFLIATLLVYKMRKGPKEIDLEEVDSPWPWNVTYFCKLNLSADDVLDGLVDHNIIGRGCSGLVYKVDIPGQCCLAVKKLWPSNGKVKEDLHAHDSFASEVETLSHIRHRNIVRLLGYCTNKTERLLLYDYMPNGSLADLLFEGRGTHVDWEMRYNIILGAAHGLAYLHHDCVPAILHRDVKSNNILLDSKFQAFLADFGLAKLVEESERAKDNMSKVAGSYGYIAPEYGYTLKITEKSDVYSYGVVLLEVITGRRAMESSMSDGLHMVEWAKMMKKSHKPTIEIVDPRLRGAPDPCIQEMEQALGVALLCINHIPHERPTMKDVVALLLEVRHPLEEYTKISQPLMHMQPRPSPPSVYGHHQYRHSSSRVSSHSGSVQPILDRVDDFPASSRGKISSSRVSSHSGSVQPILDRVDDFPASSRGKISFTSSSG